MVVQTGRIKKTVGLLLVIAIMGISCTGEIRNILQMPEREQLTVGDLLKVPVPKYFARNVQVVVDRQQGLKHQALNPGDAFPVLAQTGHLQVQYLLFGLFPFKKVDVDVLPLAKVIPGGQSIGVMLQSRGVMVVGQSPVIDAAGKKFYPAKEAGLRLGDVILKINNKEVKTDTDVAQAVNQAGQQGQKISVTVQRGNTMEEKDVNPVYCPETKRYRIGLYVRDSAAGVGTMTFYDPVSGKYGALGHVINDADTNRKIEISEGRIVASSIQSIQAGRRGQPGEKIGSFLQNSPYSGTIEKNTNCGIFGKLQGHLDNQLYSQPIATETESEVHEGPAKILTVVSGEKVESFDIAIERVLPGRMDSKSMVIRITDPRLLAITGGIVQGMSGSPIIQDGKLAGAVTHVFVNDPTRGYGVFIEQMLKEADIPKTDTSKDDAA